MKIAVFYLIGQFGVRWAQDFFQPQLQRLRDSGLYDAMDFIDIHVAGDRQALPEVPDKIRNICYHGVPGQEENETMREIHRFAKHNPGYLILFLHSDGVRHIEFPLRERKQAWRDFMEYCTIDLWKKCVDLLDYYDCTGADYVNTCVWRTDGQQRQIWAPHYAGGFWWATSNYIRKLDIGWLDQPVPWSRYLAEQWIGSGSPRAFMMFQSGVNCYFDIVKYDKVAIQQGVQQHLDNINAERRY